MTIRAVQINSGDLIGRRFNGYDLQPYLAAIDVDSRMLVYWNKQSSANFVSKAFDYPGSRYVTRGMTIIERRASLHARLHPHSWSLPRHEQVRQADIMHMHIIHDGYFSLSALPYVTRKIPAVWTWHDPWPMTGHCIYPLDCARWQTGCGSCPDLNLPFPMERDRTAEQFAWKKRTYKETKAEIVVASQWMLDMAAAAPLAQDLNFNLIPFGLDLERYKPRDRTSAREKLGVFPGRPVIFLRASSTPFKGVPDFLQALERLDPDLRLCIITVQETGLFDAFIGKHQIIEFGWTNDEDLLMDAYAACDFFAMPSKAEAFGLMAIEAMACGRPVLCVEGTSLPGVTFAPDCGVAVPKGDVAALANGINSLVLDVEACQARGEHARSLALTHYDIRQQARLTADLYGRVLDGHKGNL